MSDYFEWAKYSFDFSQSAFMAFVPGFQSAGQTSPCSSTYWKAWRTRSVSSTDRPTAVLLIVACWTTPSGSMMKRPRSAILPFSASTSYSRARSLPRSSRSGYARPLIPPPSRGFSVHARGVHFLDRAEPVEEREDLGGAHEREVEGIEEKDDPFPLVIGKTIRVELAVEDALEGEFRGHSADELGHGNSPCAGLIFPRRGILARPRTLI